MILTKRHATESCQYDQYEYNDNASLYSEREDHKCEDKNQDRLNEHDEELCDDVGEEYLVSGNAQN